MSTTEMELPQEEIAQRAYEIWQARGCPSGDGTSDWEAAVSQLASERRNGSGGLISWVRRVRQSLAAGRFN